MITKCAREDERRILEYIGSDYSSCLYLYLDLLQYGLDSDAVEVFVQQEEGEVTALLLQYYSCLHVYSKENRFCTDELARFFLLGGYKILYCRADTADLLYAVFSASEKREASVTKGWVASIEKIDRKPIGLAVKAEEKDFDQIAKLIYADEDIGKSYQFDELAKQLWERNQQGYARNLVIKQNGLVIAHACTNAERDDIAVVGELLVREGYRRRGYASEIWRTICGELLNEGKEVYSFYFSEESRALHRHIGFSEVCRWAKIVMA